MNFHDESRSHFKTSFHSNETGSGFGFRFKKLFAPFDANTTRLDLFVCQERGQASNSDKSIPAKRLIFFANVSFPVHSLANRMGDSISPLVEVLS